ncbi:type II toxin-antitoxin system RelE/ParE family toxin [Dolichospermum sp. ST_con]|jgi:plasmid stabilization system protein ParE|nr:type II toxin-antitoxin system RelE/ParE family toxin [Dolichospermum sp. DET66]MBS3032689.1 type II toxin-antitoxin system RelE/ParE family toxin [Dolichospermum sp. DET67]MBS3037895.1 type II toxin-antitoxin system RelE/ParE family toxin [Dolichospermum sp. DET50]MDD1416235.1 type II toxin-antitoxin system RelE/ParE family toxin [Dolichospermum sp. ST_con]MDD1422265.1 type II toxin-antitoxin system RelE/ParE family toxin [Dolichospermum sp. ST_sed1]MDD1425410.1 type II toxin-antitoxin sys
MNEKYQIIIQPEAQKTIEDAYFWFSNISHQKGRTWLEGLYKSILSLEKMPSRCSLAFENDFFDQEIRQLIYGKGRNTYRIIFTIVDDDVQILFVRHSAQKPMSDESE